MMKIRREIAEPDSLVARIPPGERHRRNTRMAVREDAGALKLELGIVGQRQHREGQRALAADSRSTPDRSELPLEILPLRQVHRGMKADRGLLHPGIEGLGPIEGPQRLGMLRAPDQQETALLMRGRVARIDRKQMIVADQRALMLAEFLQRPGKPAERRHIVELDRQDALIAAARFIEAALLCEQGGIALQRGDPIGLTLQRAAKAALRFVEPLEPEERCAEIGQKLDLPGIDRQPLLECFDRFFLAIEKG